MKLPFTFSLKFIFRLLFPGFILSLAMLPILQFFIVFFQVNIPVEYAFVLMVFFTGWLFVTMDMHIYMFFEGRRYWPLFRRTFLNSEKTRLASLLEKIKKTETTDYRKYVDVAARDK